jgi:tRNA-5-taurinomethyluridine 2-sulfurtransferase
VCQSQVKYGARPCISSHESGRNRLIALLRLRRMRENACNIVNTKRQESLHRHRGQKFFWLPWVLGPKILAFALVFLSVLVLRPCDSFVLQSSDSVAAVQPTTSRPTHMPKRLPESANNHYSRARLQATKHHNSNSATDLSGKNRTVESIQQMVVQRGVSWEQVYSPNMTRVPGCVANVNILAVIMEDTGVVLQGNADAIFSRGLLSLLKDFLGGKTVNQIKQLDSQTIADQLGVRSALSKGRNDGLANMVKIIQEQLSGRHQSGRPQLSQTKDDTTNFSSKNSTVALLLSGGVDSSVALRLLLQQGFQVVPFYLKIWLEDELAHLGTCPWEEDVETCLQVCEQAGVELQIVSLQDEYHRRVMQHTLNEASLGRTPNPDILCNSRVKFGCFLEYLESLPDQSFDYIASGHYAQIQRTADDQGETSQVPVKLFRAPDPVKDQSYFLCALSQNQLQRLLFPIGHLEKSQVRELAEEFELPNRHRPDSQGLCFLGKVKFRDFMQSHLGESPGNIVDAFTGEVIGTHHGVWYHTVGQRKGIGPYLKPQATAFGPWYVVAKDPTKNVVYASNRYDEDVFDEARSEFAVENVHWISGEAPAHSLKDDGIYRLCMKIRHGPKLASGTLKMQLDREEGTVRLDKKDGGLAPGQYVVFYTDQAECLGGGIISERHWAKFLEQSMVTDATKS